MRLRMTIDKGFITYSRLQLTSRSWWNTAVRSSDSTTGGEKEGAAYGNTWLSGTGVDDHGTMTSLRADGSLAARFR